MEPETLPQTPSPPTETAEEAPNLFPPETENLPTESPKETKEFPCRYPPCPESFETKRGRAAHERVHRGGGGRAGGVLRIGVGERREAPDPILMETEAVPEFIPITADQVAAIMASQGMVTNALLAPGTTAWFWTADEVNLIAPAAARMVNRSKAATALSNASDPVAVLTGSAAYVVRNVQQGGLSARAHGRSIRNPRQDPGGKGVAPDPESPPAGVEPPGGDPGGNGQGPGTIPPIPDVGPRTGLWPVS